MDQGTILITWQAAPKQCPAHNQLGYGDTHTAHPEPGDPWTMAIVRKKRRLFENKSTARAWLLHRHNELQTLLGMMFLIPGS